MEEKKKKNTVKSEKENLDFAVNENVIVESSEPEVNAKCDCGILNKKVAGIPLVFIAGGALLLLLLIIVGVNVFGNNKDILEYPVVYVNDDDEVYVGTKNGKVKKVDGDYESYGTDVSYKNKKTDKFLLINEDNLYEVTSKNGEKEKIASDVVSAMYSDDDKYIIYLNDEGEMYTYKKDGEKIAKDVDKIYDIIDGKIYYQKDGNLYVIKASGKKDAEKIASDVYSFVVSEDEKTATYMEYEDSEYNIYLYKLSNGKSKKVVSGASEIVATSEDNSKIIYVKKTDGASFNLNKILDDDLKDDDEDYMERYNGSGYNEMTYSEKYDKYYVEQRDKIRDYVKDEKLSTKSYDVYYSKNGKSTKIASDVTEVITGDVDTKGIVYIKKTLNTSDKLKISDYKYYYDFEDDVEDLLVADLYYSKNGKNEVELASKVDDANAYIVDGKQLYYVLEDDGDYTLYYGKTGKKIDAEEIDSDLSSMYLTEFKDGFVYGVDYSSKSGSFDLKYVKNGKAEKAASDVSSSKSYFISNDEKKIYFYTDYEDREGNLNYFNGSKTKVVMENISAAYYLNDDYMYVTTDCSKSGSCDLNIYKGSKKLKKIASDVTSIVSYR